MSASFLLTALVMGSFVAVPVLVQMRLQNRHPDVYQRMVEVRRDFQTGIESNRFRSGVLWDFLVRRSHKALGDPALSLLADIMLAGLTLFCVVFGGGIVFLVSYAIWGIMSV